MAIDDKELAIWLGLWKPNTPCVSESAWGWDKELDDDDCWIGYQCKSCQHVFEVARPHDIPPPDLTSDALYKAIEDALVKKGFEICYWEEVGVPWYSIRRWADDSDDPPIALVHTLLDAARAAYERENT